MPLNGILTYPVALRSPVSDSISITQIGQDQLILAANGGIQRYNINLGGPHALFDENTQNLPTPNPDWGQPTLHPYLYLFAYTTQSNVVVRINFAIANPTLASVKRTVNTFSLTPSTPFVLNAFVITTPFCEIEVENTDLASLAFVDFSAMTRSR